MPAIKHTSRQHDGMAQLDSVFSQLRQKAASGEWELETESDGDKTTLAVIIRTPPPPSKADALRSLAEEEDKRVAAKQEELQKELAELQKI